MDLGVNERGEQVVELVGGFIPVSAEGKVRARRKLDEAAARMTPEKWAQLREQFGGSHPDAQVTDYPVGVVFDTSAVLAYARSSVNVGEVLTELVDGGQLAAVPVVCLAEAAPAAVEAERLDALVAHPATVLISDDVDGWQALGHMCASAHTS